MNKRPATVSSALFLISINVIIWLALGMIIVLGAHPALPDDPASKTMLAVLSFIAAGVLFGALMLAARHNRIGYFIALAALIVSSILTIFDDFGWSDLIVLVISLAPVFLLIKDRSWYLQPAHA